MIRKIGFTLLCASGLLTTNVFATTYHTLRQGLAIEYELPANAPQVFSNIFFWRIIADCVIISENLGNPLSVTMLKKTGSINTTPLSTGDSIGLTVQQGQSFHVTAMPGAQVELVNLGNKLIKASCTT